MGQKNSGKQSEEHESWRKELAQIINIEVPRNYFNFIPTQIEQDDTESVSLLDGKTRVALKSN